MAQDMEWRDVADLYRYWRECPPVHELAAGFMGYKPPPDPTARPAESLPAFADIKSAFSSSERRGIE